MAQPKNAMEIFKLLDKSNCRKCGKPTCLAFAAGVFTGEKRIDECPSLSSEIVERYGDKADHKKPGEQEFEEAIAQLKEEIAAIDLASAATRVGGRYADGKLTIPILGKEFSVDSAGDISTSIHVNRWIAPPVLDYIINCKGTEPSGKWVPLRELNGGKDWHRLFGQRCEKPLKKVADEYTDIFEYMIRVFNGKQAENHYESDISLILHPLPKLPILICYWKPEDGLESNLNIFFDETAEDNLNIQSIYILAAGLALMFEKIALHHGK